MQKISSSLFSWVGRRERNNGLLPHEGRNIQDADTPQVQRLLPQNENRRVMPHRRIVDQFRDAIQLGNLEEVNMLLGNVTRDQLIKLLAHRDDDGNNLLHFAIKLGRQTAVGLLLQFIIGVDQTAIDPILMEIDTQGNTLFHLGVLNGMDNVILLLWNNIRQDQFNELLIQQNRNGHTLFDLAVRNERNVIAELFLNRMSPNQFINALTHQVDKAKGTLLHYLTVRRQDAMMDLILKHVARCKKENLISEEQFSNLFNQVNWLGRTWLEQALEIGADGIVELFFNNMGQEQIYRVFNQKRNNENYTLLELAVIHGREVVLRLFFGCVKLNFFNFFFYDEIGGSLFVLARQHRRYSIAKLFTDLLESTSLNNSAQKN